jgi:hypothetical protein
MGIPLKPSPNLTAEGGIAIKNGGHAHYSVGLDYSRIPAIALEAAKYLILDQLACQIGVSNKP